MPSKAWDGRGNPPSHEAAVQWLIANGYPEDRARKLPRLGAGYEKSRGQSKGDYWRNVLETYQKSPQRRTDYQRQLDTERTRGRARTADLDRDGTVDEAEAAIAVGEGNDVMPGSIEDIIASGPGASATDRGAPLLPGGLGGLAGGDFTVENRSHRWGSFETGTERVGPRYHEADILEPMKWSEERRANLQREMLALGLYGDRRVRLGTWTEADQILYGELLTAANVEGRTWYDQLKQWKRVPPVDLLDKVNGGGIQKQTIQITNPVDIRAAGEQVSRSLIGRVDRGFAESAVSGYQAQEIAGQGAVSADQQAGGGGTVTREPSLEAYLQDRMRREQPLEVDGHSFVKTFESFIDMLGPGGG